LKNFQNRALQVKLQYVDIRIPFKYFLEKILKKKGIGFSCIESTYWLLGLPKAGAVVDVGEANLKK
jgi:hypothetical protein